MISFSYISMLITFIILLIEILNINTHLWTELDVPCVETHLYFPVSSSFVTGRLFVSVWITAEGV